MITSFTLRRLTRDELRLVYTVIMLLLIAQDVGALVTVEPAA
ncbi:MAG TPA: hypothetical protein PK607_13795 [Aggregatilineales bacterium]|nr:hypothetical protein [Aggregatilineales bacterium]HQE19573.1 hypothetical protein [Aggregatilineales bacterium]